MSRRLGFTGSKIERADNLRLDETKMAELAASPSARLVALDGLDPLLDAEGRLLRTSMAELPQDGEAIFLGLDGDTSLFAPLPQSQPDARPAWAMFRTLDVMAAEDAAIWGCARSLIVWHGRHRFCANCGGHTQVFRAGWARRCAKCSAEHFPRVDPVVIMLAEHKGEVLLGRQPQYPPGRYSALAGFVEPGESIEEAVARELMEEAGVAVTSVRYVASQPWPFPGSLMIACIAKASGRELAIDRTELEDAMWVDAGGVRSALAQEADAPFQAPPHYAIAHSLLLSWLEGG